MNCLINNQFGSTDRFSAVKHVNRKLSCPPNYTSFQMLPKCPSGFDGERCDQYVGEKLKYIATFYSYAVTRTAFEFPLNLH